MSIKLDLHIHTISRGKVYIDHNELKNSLCKNDLDGVAITNFFDIYHAAFLKKKLSDYIIIIGQEIWTKDGHIIGLGLKERIDNFKTALETIKIIHDQGGIAIAPHPYIYLGVGKKVLSLPIDAIESYNAYLGNFLFYNYLAARSAKMRNITQVSATDTTNAELVGRSHTEIMVEDSNYLLDGIKKGKVRLYKRALPIPFIFFLKNIFYFKNIEPCPTHATPCFICGKSITVRLFKKKFKCIDCGKIEFSHIACCNGHYLCMKCIMKRNVKNDTMLLYE